MQTILFIPLLDGLNLCYVNYRYRVSGTAFFRCTSLHLFSGNSSSFNNVNMEMKVINKDIDNPIFSEIINSDNEL